MNLFSHLIKAYNYINKPNIDNKCIIANSKEIGLIISQEYLRMTGKEYHGSLQIPDSKFLLPTDNMMRDLYSRYFLPFLEAFEIHYEDSFDCFSINEEIWTDKGTKKIKDLEIGDIALSYDFTEKKYVYKPITNIWEKGKLKIKRVFFKNGLNIDITENHHLFIKLSKDENYQRKELSLIDNDSHWRPKIPCVKNLPYTVKDIEWLTEDVCFIIGHYIAEGWKDKQGNTWTSGYDCDIVIKKLEDNDIPFTENHFNGNGVPQVYFKRNSKLWNYLSLCGNNAFNKNIPEEMLSLPKEKIISLLDGYFLGDGHTDGNKEINYTTSSETLAQQLQELHLKIGKPLWVYFQFEHQGAGKQPIWRLLYNPNSRFCKNYGYDGLSEVGIKYIQDIEDEYCRDIEIQDTHLVILKNGIITSNCDNFGLTYCDVNSLLKYGIASGFLYYKNVKTNIGHCKGFYINNLKKLCIVEPQSKYFNIVDLTPEDEMLFLLIQGII